MHVCKHGLRAKALIWALLLPGCGPVREADRRRRLQEEEYERTGAIFRRAIGLDEEVSVAAEDEDDVEEATDEEVEDVLLGDAGSGLRPPPGAGQPVRAAAHDKDADALEEAIEDEEEEEEDGVLLEVEEEEEDSGGLSRRQPAAAAEFVAGLAVEGDLNVTVSGIQQDSRNVSQGDLFVCCVGQKTDGHNYAAQAVEKGAVAVITMQPVAIKDGVKAVVLLNDTNAVLSALAAAFYRSPSLALPIVGITGTNGKTTTSYLLRSIYEALGAKTGLLGTIAYAIGSRRLDAPHTTPDAISLQRLLAAMVHQDCEAVIMEVSSHALALGRCTAVDFDVAVFTNLTRDHMDFHETEADYRAAKGKLFAKMVDPSRHRKIVNIDDPQAQYFINQGSPDVPVVTYGMERGDADVFPLEVQLSLFETELVLRTPKGNIEISSGLLGRHNVYNIMAAVAVGLAVDAPLEHIVRGVEEVDAVPGRCELIDEEQAFAVIVDYAHTPDALSRLLDTVRECGPNRIITVVGCGGNRDQGKRPIMAKIATDKSDICIFTSDNPRDEDPLDILDDMLAGVGWTMEEYLKMGEEDYYPPLPNGHRLFVYDIRSIAVRAAVAMGEEGDAVVVAGKGHETYQITGTERDYFDDREECREALQHVDALHAAGIDTSEFPWRVPES
eukprot:SM000074S21673  [mRNA]  locus=s74:214947:219012:- [translate_table: standard]